VIKRRVSRGLNVKTGMSIFYVRARSIYGVNRGNRTSNTLLE